MKTIVISGINLFEGGPLSVYKDCLNSIIENRLNEKNNIIAFVHKKELFKEYTDKITLIELPKSRENYLYRIWYEYIYFYLYSRHKNIDVWLSLHDITPNVKAKKRYVYCHNASPFYKMTKTETRFAPRLKLFNLFYKYLYKINIRKNDYVIVQQDWIKKRFMQAFNIENIIVAHPDTSSIKDNGRPINYNNEVNSNLFFYPSVPRVFKNFEVICEAAQILNKKGISNYKIVLTLDGTENSYSKYLINKYKEVENVKFVGLLKRENVYNYYAKSDCLIFPSKLESWGLPITEYKNFGKPIILANTEYAKETLGTYDKVRFFDPNSSEDLARILEEYIDKRVEWDSIQLKMNPDTSSWSELLNIIL
ncbi:glycosyltransferase [Aquibacillus koreensis]|uniref:Glycosyltransferase n=1 Tax=Aquibacillus koreensis TaxID=279446 RepID=A0A9X3WJ00_9BACI|nr:glycosyltransferase [Aquibacillus koreensis]MCT2534634.1 glycosyltransferase [Aquibacillus koreensis]MDC3419818.1 glycosyltransferase [Aquibacillus koreensis]